MAWGATPKFSANVTVLTNFPNLVLSGRFEGFLKKAPLNSRQFCQWVRFMDI